MPRLVEASGASVMVNSCFKLLQKGAELVFIGLHRQPFHVDDFLNDIVFKSLTLHTVHGKMKLWISNIFLFFKKKVKLFNRSKNFWYLDEDRAIGIWRKSGPKEDYFALHDYVSMARSIRYAFVWKSLQNCNRSSTINCQSTINVEE